jgi:hypothetical protein
MRLRRLTAWPLAVVTSGGSPVGIAMRDVRERFAVPFVMPSGRRDRVLLTLEHLLGADSYLQMRGLGVRLDTVTRTWVAGCVSAALAFLHRHAIVASDIAPNNLLVCFGPRGPAVCFIDCDSMVFRGRQALVSVETGDWDVPREFGEPAGTRPADAYKLGLLVLRLFARSHDAREMAPQVRHVPGELRPLLSRALAPDAANRPPAGEWQRALRHVLMYGYLNERYPGPFPHTPAANTVPPSVAGHQPASAPALPAQGAPARALGSPVLAQATAAVVSGSPGLAHAPQSPSAAPQPRAAGGDRLRRTVIALWMLVGTLVLFLALSRLFAAAIPAQNGGGAAPGISGGASGLYRYYNGPPANAAGATPPSAAPGTQLP